MLSHGHLTRSQMILVLAGYAGTDCRTSRKYVDDPGSVRPAIRERLDMARQYVSGGAQATVAPPPTVAV